MGKGGLVLAAAAFDLALVLFHLAFWRLFRWPARLKASGTINTAVTQTLNAMLSFTMGAYAVALLIGGAATPAQVLWAGAVYWALRTVLQPVFFPSTAGWSLGLAALFGLGAAIHAAAALA